ncbi:signal peptidase II [Microlunatus panaciterrae]|uniref:Lipoprotein signal peptidase n=1 Tax=Microlunatus panaciterrae TaxID=400768 RepID=A0ABS2RMI4_9ACTN|nr:signal peptidase II [Microlunatus panaciterrae]MBM7800215.1 signal peptidase II [Microlunatus panaciterrae]
MQATRGTAIADSTLVVRRSPRGLRLLFAGVALTGLVLDIATKVLAMAYLDGSRPVRLLGGLLHLHLVRNPGAAFSLGEKYTVVFAALSILVLVFVLVRLVPKIGHAGWSVALGLLTAGVAGNLGDRLFRDPGFLHGHVVDFLQLPRWPIFNVADMCITAAAVAIMFLSVVRNVTLDGRRYIRPAKEPSAGSAAESPQTEAEQP